MSNPNVYFPGDRVLCIHMDDPHPVSDGTRGTIEHIDDAGQIHVRWDTGSSLALVPGIDEFRHLTEKELREERNNANV